MVQMIRLSSTNNSGEISSTFNEDIRVKANSKIALNNLAVEIVPSSIQINSSNNNISWQLTTAGGVKNIVLNNSDPSGIIAPANYNRNNYKSLFNDIQTKMNQSLGYPNPKDIGTQVQVAEDSDGKVVIETKQYPNNDAKIFTDLSANINKASSGTITSNPLLFIGGTGPSIEISAITGSVGEDNNKKFTFVSMEACKGCSEFRARIGSMANYAGGAPLTNGLILAMVDVDPHSLEGNAVQFPNSSITYGIRIAGATGTGENYKSILKGVEVDSGSAMSQFTNGDINNDSLVIHRGNGRLQGLVYTQGSATPITVFDVTDSQPAKPLYPVIIIRGGRTGATKNASVNNIRYTADPYVNDPTASINHDDDNLGVAPPRQTNINSNMSFSMNSTLRTFLGYNQEFTNGNYPFLGVVRLYLQAQTKFESTDNADNFLIMSDTLLLDSYDDYQKEVHSGGGRASILATVPSNDSGEFLLHEPNNLIYINLKNNYDFNIRNLKFRILRNDYEPVSTSGFLTMTILIKEPNE